ncbi:MAG: hypothetical protein QM755_21195 [Luteolibacter sp.]
MIRKALSVCILVAAASPLHGTVIVADDFSGSSSTNLSGLTTDVGGKTWTADALFKADGSYTTGSNVDRGAALDLGATFFADQFAAGNNTIILTVTFGASGNANSFAYAGFTTDSWTAATTTAVASEFNVGARAQSQGVILGLEYDTIGAVSSSLHQDNTAGDSGTDIRTALSSTLASTYTMTITADGSGFANSTVTLSDGTNTASITGYNANALRTLYLGVEATTGTSSANFDSIQLQAIPEPSAAVLGGLGLLVLARRRR